MLQQLVDPFQEQLVFHLISVALVQRGDGLSPRQMPDETLDLLDRDSVTNKLPRDAYGRLTEEIRREPNGKLKVLLEVGILFPKKAGMGEPPNEIGFSQV
jgi:hypothetical protein